MKNNLNIGATVTIAVIGLFVMGLTGAAGVVNAQTADERPQPCAEHERFTDFDFWIGHWEVRTKDDALAGENRISREQNGCVLVERWQGSQGGSGTSMNFYDEAAGNWTQVWSGGGGSQILIRGGLEDGSMKLVGKIQYVGKASGADFRGTWTPLEDGRVRQFFEQSNDGGKTWEPWFDGYYTRIDTRDGED